MPKRPIQKEMVPGITFVQELGGISEYTLTKNGLRILLAPDASTPVAGVMVTYHVGSRNEATGYTGATHLLEHLMFKGSEKFHPKEGNSIDALLENKGGMLNATTYFDRTNYFEIIPKDVLPLAIEVEADRMRNATFTETDRQTEMPVVRNEYELRENEPSVVLDTAIWATAFMAHPYHHPTIGWRSDIEGVSIERLRQFYDDYYWPDNATITIAGDFDTREVLRLIQTFFGMHSRKEGGYPAMYTTEPPQEGQRIVTVRRAGIPLFSLSHKIPHALHEDMPALVLLASILHDGKTSRLHKRFIDTALATDVTVYCNQLRDASLFQAFITLTPTTSHEKAEQLLVKEYALICKEGVTAQELTAAKRSARVFFSRRTDGPYALLSAINEDLAAGDWAQYHLFPMKLQKVTAKDIQRVAKTYLREDQSTVGNFIPTNP